MKIVMTLLVRHEADIVEQCLVYHLNQGVDHVLVIDDGSADGTPEILDSFREAGLATIVPRPPGAFWSKQGEWLTLLARKAATELQADWVLPGDADEFWWPLWGDLKDVLGSVPRDREAVIAPRNDFVFVSPPSRSAPQDFTIREQVSALLPKIAFRTSSVVAVSQGGAHRVSSDPKLTQVTDTDVGRPLRVAPMAGLRIFHYAARSEAQVERVSQGVVQGRATDRDALRRRVASNSPFFGLSGDWRQEVVARGIDEGDLVVDHRLALFYERCRDPRQVHRPPRTPEASTQTDAVDEILDVQTLIIDSLSQQEGLYRRRIGKLNRAAIKEREARARGPLSSARRALARLLSLAADDRRPEEPDFRIRWRA